MSRWHASVARPSGLGRDRRTPLTSRVARERRVGHERHRARAQPARRLAFMPGSVALVGAGEFLPEMGEIDRSLLSSTGRTRPRVAILATASFPDGEEVFQRWLSMGTSHFSQLGAEVEPVVVRDRTDADDSANIQAVGEADLVYLSGGKPAYLLSVLAESALASAIADVHARGAILAGCSAGAMVLAERQFDFRFRGRPIPWPVRWRRSLSV